MMQFKTTCFSAMIVGMGLLFALLSPQAAFSDEKELVISYSPGTLFHQLVRDRTKMVYEQAGIKARFIPLPHNRSLMSANDGTVDGDVGRVPSVEEKYPGLVRVNVKLMDLNGAVYTSRDDIQSFNARMLKELRVGYVLGVRWTEKKMKDLKATTARDYPSLFQMLLQDRVDIVLATEASAESVMVDFGDRAAAIRKLRPFVFNAPIYHYLNKKHIHLVPVLEKTLTEMIEHGAFN